jgi:hypothetical protein
MLTRMARTTIATLVLAGGLLATARTSVVSGSSAAASAPAGPARVARHRARPPVEADGCREEPAPLPTAPQGCVDPGPLASLPR